MTCLLNLVRNSWAMEWPLGTWRPVFPTSEWLGPRDLGIQPTVGSNLTSHAFELIYMMGIIIIIIPPYELLHDSNEMSK